MSKKLEKIGSDGGKDKSNFDKRTMEAIDYAFYKFASKCFEDRLDVSFKGG